MSMFTEFTNHFPVLLYPVSGYSLFRFSDKIYLGVGSNNEVVLAIESLDPQRNARTIYTDSLQLILNSKANLVEDSANTLKTMNLLSFKPKDQKGLKVFFEICGIFATGDKIGSTDNMTEIFETIRSMFAKGSEISFSELQGLFAELYLIYKFRNDFNLAKFWHSEENQKFDFSLSPCLKIEVKSTTGPLRQHHFMHDQLSSDMYTIHIASFMFQRDDQGLPLEELINSVHDLLLVNEKQFTRVQKIILNTEPALLSTVSFNQLYTENCLNFYKGTDVPRFAGTRPTGVTNAEYDSVLENVPVERIEEILRIIQIEINTSS